MLMKKGKKGNEVLTLQYALHIVCCPPGDFDGIFGSKTEQTVLAYQKSRGLEVDGIVGDITWGQLMQEMTKISQALDGKGFRNGTEDWSAGKEMFQAILDFQKKNGLSADGMVGPKTMQALGMKKSPVQSEENESAPTGTEKSPAQSDERNERIPFGTTSAILRRGSTGTLTKYLQQMLKTLGYAEMVNGNFGDSTQASVLAFQRQHGLTQDGIVGSETWKELFRVYQIPCLPKGATGLADAARYELELGFAEDYSNNITPYGIWYGMNGEPWCAMFVSWCADQAGVLESTVPRFAYCPYGVSWYRGKGKFGAAGSCRPKCGDTVFFGSRITGEINHTGIVTAVTETEVTTIEGNSGDRVRLRTYNLEDPYIYGYGING